MSLQSALDDLAQSMVPADLKAKGWRYIDPPARFTPEMFAVFLQCIGHDEYQCLAVTKATDKEGPYRRGQFFISPQGAANLADADRCKRIMSKPVRHPDCPCEAGNCIYPECTCALPPKGKDS